MEFLFALYEKLSSPLLPAARARAAAAPRHALKSLSTPKPV